MSDRDTDSTWRGTQGRAQLPLLDRLIDGDPDTPFDPPMSGAAAMAILRTSIRNDLEALLNTRRRWRSWDPQLGQLEVSPVGFGLPDFAGGAFSDPIRREELRRRIETCIREFEPRFASLNVMLIEGTDKLSSTLRLRIEALMHAEPAPEPITFDTVIDPTNMDVAVLADEA